MATNTDQNRLMTSQHHIEDMRNMIICKICLKPLYEPFILACGHTYCYGCLRSWFNGLDHRRRKINCPDCRSEVKLTPAPNYILRDLVHMFVSRTELLPEDETIEDHDTAKKTEATLLANDRDGPGIFEGIFKKFVHPMGIPVALRDHISDRIDGVMRCPQCLWELEEGICFQCGWSVEDYEADFSDEFDDDSMNNEELSLMNAGLTDASDYDSLDGMDTPHAHRTRSIFDDANSNEDTDAFSGPDYGTSNPYGADEDEDEDEDEMNSFIDDNDEDEPDEVDLDDLGTSNVPRHRINYEIPDEDEEDEEESVDNGLRTASNTVASSRRANGRRRRVASSTSSEEESDSEERHDQDDEQQTNYDESSDDENRSASPVRAAPIQRRRPLVISDDEDQDSSRDSTPNAQDQDKSEDIAPQNNEDTDTDDTATPPQPSANRRQRLVTQRARRNTPSVWRAIARGRNDEFTSRNQRRNIVGAN